MKQKTLMLISTLLMFILVLFFMSDETKKEDNIKKIAFVSLSHVDDNTFKGFKLQMKKYGWDENKNINYIVPGAAIKAENLNSIINSVIQKKPNLILVSSTPATQEVKRLTIGKNIPVVFCPVNDPVGSQIVSNPKMPEGDITGIRLPVGDIKRFEWLHAIAPSVKTVLVPYTPNDDSSIASRDNIIKIANQLKIKIIQEPFSENISIDQFFSKIPKSIEAIFLPRDSRMEVKIDSFVNYAIKNKLPLSAPSYQQVQKGALFTFGFIHTELGIEAAKMVDKILKGVKPADLPIKSGNAYLVINEKTAKKIGIKIPANAIRNAKLIIK